MIAPRSRAYTIVTEIEMEERFVKHASAAALHGLSELLGEIRAKEGIKEKKLGIFYRKSKSFLHFHEDPAGLFADLRAGAEFGRYPVNTPEEWKALLTAIDLELNAGQVSRRRIRQIAALE